MVLEPGTCDSLFAHPPQLLLGTASRLSREKGIADLLGAAEIVLRMRRDIGFVVFGEGPERDRLARQARHAGVSDRFVLAGFQDHVQAVIGQWDLAVLPSRTEGLSNAILEAMAAGLPVLATNVGGTPELIRHEETGWLVPPRSPARLAAAILKLADSPPLRSALGAAARRRVRECFSYAAVASQYRAVLSRVVDGQLFP